MGAKEAPEHGKEQELSSLIKEKTADPEAGLPASTVKGVPVEQIGQGSASFFHRISLHIAKATLAGLCGLAAGLVAGLLLYLAMWGLGILHGMANNKGGHDFPKSDVPRITGFVHMLLGIVYYTAYACDLLSSLYFAVPLAVNVGLVVGSGVGLVGVYFVALMGLALWFFACELTSYLLNLDAKCDSLRTWVWIVLIVIGFLPGILVGWMEGDFVFYKARGGPKSHSEYFPTPSDNTKPTEGA